MCDAILEPRRAPYARQLVPLLVAATTLFYEARVPSFGCSSSDEVLKLEAVRSDPMAFGRLLTAQVAYGQCVAIPRGAVVEGATTTADAPTLLINAESDPPGYVVPSKDFSIRPNLPATSKSP